MCRHILGVAAFYLVCFIFQIDAEDDDRIVGGFDADDGAFPYQISLRYKGFHICGGSILNEHFILTAAHCIDGFKGNVSNLTVVTGTNLLDSGGDSYEPQKLIPHSQYSANTITNDIALIKLNDSIKYGEKVHSIKLPEKDVSCHTELTLSGWGTTAFPGQPPNKLQTIKLYSISHVRCVLEHPQANILQSNVCTFTKTGEGACHGDSGGPLVHDGYQVGVVSWGIPCAKGKPDVFTKVFFYKDWINENMV